MSLKITIELQVDGGANAMDKLYIGASRKIRPRWEKIKIEKCIMSYRRTNLKIMFENHKILAAELYIEVFVEKVHTRRLNLSRTRSNNFVYLLKNAYMVAKVFKLCALYTYNNRP